MNQENQWIYRLAQGDEEVLGFIYKKFRSNLISWLVKTGRCELQEAEEIYQITILIFYDKVLSGKLTALTSSLKTYLFAIGKNKLRETQRRQAKLTNDYLFEHIVNNDSIEDKQSQETNLQQIERALGELDERCRKILELFYYNKCSIEKICARLELSSVNATKMKKSRCLNKLRDMVVQ